MAQTFVSSRVFTASEFSGGGCSNSRCRARHSAKSFAQGDMSIMTDAESASGRERFAVGWCVQLFDKCPCFPHRKQMGGGLPFPPSPPVMEVEPDDVPGTVLVLGAYVALDEPFGAPFLLWALPFPLPLPSPFLLVLPNRACLPSSAGTTTG